jgi:hypothetical protein
MFNDAIDTAAAWAALQTGSKLIEIGWLTGGDDFHVAFFGVADPAAQIEFAGLAMYEPAEADALHAALNKEVKDHGQ